MYHCEALIITGTSKALNQFSLDQPELQTLPLRLNEGSLLVPPCAVTDPIAQRQHHAALTALQSRAEATGLYSYRAVVYSDTQPAFSSERGKGRDRLFAMMEFCPAGATEPRLTNPQQTTDTQGEVLSVRHTGQPLRLLLSHSAHALQARRDLLRPLPIITLYALGPLAPGSDPAVQPPAQLV